jgi:hypothetical protein
MILSKTCLLLFGLILCAVLIAMLTQNYNEALYLRVSDLVKIKRGRETREVNPEGYRGGHTPDVVRVPGVREYNNEFKKENISSFRDRDPVGQIKTIHFLPNRMF